MYASQPRSQGLLSYSMTKGRGDEVGRRLRCSPDICFLEKIKCCSIALIIIDSAKTDLKSDLCECLSM